MFKLLIVVPLFVLAIYGECLAQYFSDTDTMSMEPVSGYPGDTIAVTFDLVNTFTVGGFQIRATYNDTTFSALDMHLSSRSQGLDLYGSYFDVPGVASLFATSWNPIQNAIPPGRGAIAILRFLVLPGALPGSYFIRFVDSDSLSHENSLSNMWGDSLVVPILIDNEVQVLPGSGVRGDAPVPISFGLGQNFPNPFNGATRISFILDKPQVVDLTIFDLLGHPVASLYSGQAQAGEHIVFWDSQATGKSMASGTYFYRIKGQQSGSLTRMMTLLK